MTNQTIFNCDTVLLPIFKSGAKQAVMIITQHCSSYTRLAEKALFVSLACSSQIKIKINSQVHREPSLVLLLVGWGLWFVGWNGKTYSDKMTHRP